MGWRYFGIKAGFVVASFSTVPSCSNVSVCALVVASFSTVSCANGWCVSCRTAEAVISGFARGEVSSSSFRRGREIGNAGLDNAKRGH